MRLPRDIGGEQLAKLLRKYGYQITRQTGSHIRLTTRVKGEHHLTIPRHQSLKVGTLSSILSDITKHLEIDKQSLIKDLFGKYSNPK
jgi:predicted RNA binding protein YcfA (HicA-like mRNA interferase family)